MEKITRDEFMQALRDYHPALHCELYSNYRAWYFGEEVLAAEFFSACGCAIVYSAYEYEGKYHANCYIHEVSDDCDFAEACRQCKDYADADCAKHENVTLTIVLIHHGELSDKLDEFRGFRKFARMGEAFEPDPHVCELTRENADEIKELCDPAILQNDTWFGKAEAESFWKWDFEWGDSEGIRMLGWRDETGKLLGIASWSSEDELNIAWLHDIFVSPEGRGRGIGKALVRTAVGKVPDRLWNYQAAQDNAPSIALAKSCGFTLDGANLFVYCVCGLKFSSDSAYIPALREL